MSTQSQGYVVVGNYPDAIQAHIARGRLEAEGFDVRLVDEHFVSSYWMLSNAVMGVKLWVAADQAEEAWQLLQAAPLPEAATEVARCAQCGGDEFVLRRATWRWAMLSVHMLSIPLPFGGGRRVCKACGAPAPTDA